MEAIIAKLKQFDVASVSDALDRLGIPCGMEGIHPVVGGKRICGPAFTVHYIPCGTEQGNVGDFLDDVAPGQVVVIDNGGRCYCTVWGDIMTCVAAHRGIEGTIIDGVCRDVPGIKQYDYGIFTKGTYMVTGKDRVTVDGVNIPVAVSGIQVCPGDIILADDSGALCVPACFAEQAAEIAENIERVESEIIKQVRQGRLLKDARKELGYHHLQSAQGKGRSSCS